MGLVCYAKSLCLISPVFPWKSYHPNPLALKFALHVKQILWQPGLTTDT